MVFLFSLFIHFILFQIRAFNTFTTLEWIYLSVALVALTVSLGITISRLTVEKPYESDFTFAILLLVTICKNKNFLFNI